MLEESGVEARYLELDLTEGTLLHDNRQTLETTRAVRAMGVSIAIDDFGTGYSSLSYLRRFPIQVLKIDRSFIQDLMEEDIDNRTIVEATINMAHKLGKQVIAEGVEHPDQADYLRRSGCDLLQGYQFSQPLVASEFEAKWFNP